MGTVYRDAGTGEYVTEEYAKANPGTTVSETETPPATVTGGAEEGTDMANEKMKEDPRSEQAQEQQARREQEAAERQAEKDAREADRQPHPDNTLPDQQ